MNNDVERNTRRRIRKKRNAGIYFRNFQRLGGSYAESFIFRLIICHFAEIFRNFPDLFPVSVNHDSRTRRSGVRLSGAVRKKFKTLRLGKLLGKSLENRGYFFFFLCF